MVIHAAELALHQVATGSEDSSLKLLDVKKMKSAQQIPNPADDAARPVTRTFYDHVNGVRALAFHPTKPLLASGGADCTIRFPRVIRVRFQSGQD